MRAIRTLIKPKSILIHPKSSRNQSKSSPKSSQLQFKANQSQARIKPKPNQAESRNHAEILGRASQSQAEPAQPQASQLESRASWLSARLGNQGAPGVAPCAPPLRGARRGARKSAIKQCFLWNKSRKFVGTTGSSLATMGFKVPLEPQDDWGQRERPRKS